jgi:cell cycle sensor histidine kinase DivJ
LSLVKGLVALHDGTMSIESASGEGTKVTISLPVEGPRERVEKPAVVSMPVATTKEDGYGPLRKTA